MSTRYAGPGDRPLPLVGEITSAVGLSWDTTDPQARRVAEVLAQDIHLADDGGTTYRTKLRVSFKYEAGE